MTRAALLCGAAVPLLYFGTQLAAAPLSPGYDFVRQAASELGSPASRAPGVFNTGAILTGLCGVVAAFGFARALPAAGVPRALALLVAVAVGTSGLAGIQAGVFPLPHPNHNPRWLGAGLFVLPALLAVALWNARVPGRNALRAYLVASTLLFLLQFPLRAGVFGLDERSAGGLMQRLLALAVYPTIGVTALVLLKREP